MKTRSNERLCAQAQKGDENARSLLLERIMVLSAKLLQNYIGV